MYICLYVCLRVCVSGEGGCTVHLCYAVFCLCTYICVCVCVCVCVCMYVCVCGGAYYFYGHFCWQWKPCNKMASSWYHSSPHSLLYWPLSSFLFFFVLKLFSQTGFFLSQAEIIIFLLVMYSFHCRLSMVPHLRRCSRKPRLTFKNSC